MEEVLGRRVNRYLEQVDLSPHDGKRDESFASLPSLVVIDGGKGQLSAGMRALGPFVERGVTVVGLAKRLEEVYVPGRSAPIDLAADSEASKLLQRVRDEAHRFAIEHHRGRRDRAMTGSVLDELKGIGPARKRALLQHFGSPERFLAATPRGARGGARRAWQGSPRDPRAAEQDGLMAKTGEARGTGCRSATATAPAGRSTLVVITGHSGAGKSEAIAAFEDGGYFCVDNLPPRMIGSLGELFRHEGSGVERAAVVSDVRGGEYFDDLLQVLDDLEADGLKPTVLFLEADEETLLDRYKETRRRHPLAPEGRIVDGIRAERELLAPLRERADVVMDTSDLTGGMLRRRIAEEMLGDHESGKLALTLLTFGFKNGPPRDADLTLDVRFLPNPHYVDELRPLTGLDRRVRDYVESGTQAGEFYGRLLPLLEFLVPAYVTEGKSHLTIAVGCTGGRHRSVTVADRIRRDLEARDDVVVHVKHRDADGVQTSPCGVLGRLRAEHAALPVSLPDNVCTPSGKRP